MRMKKKILSLFFLPLLFWGCNEPPAARSLLLGQWRFQDHNIHTILHIKSSRKWHVDIRMEGVTTRLIERKGNASGEWETNEDETTLTMRTTEGLVEIGWEEGTIVYEITKLDPLTLHLTNPEGKTIKWKKVRNRAVGATTKDVTSIRIAPVLVNLAKDKYWRRYKWICADVALIMAQRDLPQNIHPRISERIMFFLSSKTYLDVNSQEKLRAMRKELRDVLNPYLNGELLEVDFNKFTLTGRKEAVENFLAEYEAEAEGEGDS